MALRQGCREQIQMLPASIEEYVAEDAPVRAYDAFVEALDLEGLGIDTNPSREGNPSYDPKTMLKLLVYGYSYGVRSSRKLERETYYNLSFIWLTGGLKPDHKTIAEFRRRNKGALQKAMVQCVRICIKLDLIAGNILFVDGSKIRGNASIKSAWTKEKCEQVLRKAEKRIAEIIAEAEVVDKEETGLPSFVAVRKELEDTRNIKQRVEQVMEELKQSNKTSLNTVDRDCTRIHSVHGTAAGYSAQMVVDDKNGLIVSCDTVSANSDMGQFSTQIDKAKEILGKPCQTAVADAGYAHIDDLHKVSQQGVQVLVPTQILASGKEFGEFDKRKFRYDRAKDCCYCPRGEILTYHSLTTSRNGRVFKIKKPETCFSCPHYGKCTTSKRGRKVCKLDNEEFQERLEQELIMPHNKAIYKRRQEKVELVFGHIKRNLSVSGFLLRGLDGVKAETSLLSICFNVRRLISLLGNKGLAEHLQVCP